MSDVNDSQTKLEEWKNLSSDLQLTKVRKASVKYDGLIEVLSVRNQAIEVNLFVEKSEIYSSLVDYETYLREQLGNFPIIVLLKARSDENKKRK